MAKTRKKPLTNETVIERLCAAGLWSGGTSWTHDDTYQTQGPFAEQFKKGSGTIGSYYYYAPVWNYMIPIKLYKEHVASTYRVFIPIGKQVRKRSKSSRQRERTSYSNVLCDTKDFDHLGIGTGKIYKSSRVDEILQRYHASSNSYSPYGNSLLPKGNMRVLIGNKSYPANALRAYERATRLRERGVKKKSPHFWYDSTFGVNDFLQTVKIKGDGFFGPKEKINGVIKKYLCSFSVSYMGN
jgi:hypothetical protein